MTTMMKAANQSANLQAELHQKRKLLVALHQKSTDQPGKETILPSFES